MMSEAKTDATIVELLQRPRRRTAVQLPMHTFELATWRGVVCERMSLQLKLLSNHRGPDQAALENFATSIIADPDRMVTDALQMHVHAFGLTANAEIGFDLGIRPKHVLVGGEGGYAVVFATIRTDACARLLERHGVQAQLRRMTSMRRRRQIDASLSGRVPKAEHRMDLLVAALPGTTACLGAATPRSIVEMVARRRFGQLKNAAIRARALEGD